MINICTDPSVTGPNFNLNLGDHQGVLIKNPTPFNMTGGRDETWWLLQWDTPSTDLFDPTKPIINNSADYDHTLGNALYSWNTGNANGSSGFVVYGYPQNYTYRLSVMNSRTTLLSFYTKDNQTFTFDHPMKLSSYQRITKTSIGEPHSGGAYTGNNFTVGFNDPLSPYYNPKLPNFGMFLQIGLTDNRGEPGSLTTIRKGQYNQAMYNVDSLVRNGDTTICNLSRQYLLFQNDNGPLHHIEIDLNQALLQMAKYMANIDPDNAGIFLDMKNWKLGSYFAGPEARLLNYGLSHDIGHTVITYDENKIFSSSDPVDFIQKIDGGNYDYYTNSKKIVSMASNKNKIFLLPNTIYYGSKIIKYNLTSNGEDTIDTTDLDSRSNVEITTNNISYISTGKCDHTINLNSNDRQTIFMHSSKENRNTVYCNGNHVNNSLTFYGGQLDIYNQTGYMLVSDSSDITQTGSSITANAGKGSMSIDGSTGYSNINIYGANDPLKSGGTQYVYGQQYSQAESRFRIFNVRGGFTNQIIKTGCEKFFVVGKNQIEAKKYTITIEIETGELDFISGFNPTTFNNKNGSLKLELNHDSEFNIQINMQDKSITEVTSKVTSNSLRILNLYNISPNDVVVIHENNNSYITNKKSKAKCIIYNSEFCNVINETANTLRIITKI